MIPELDLVTKSIDRFFNASPFQMVLPCADEQADARPYWNTPMFQPTVKLNVIDTSQITTQLPDLNHVECTVNVNSEEVIVPSPPFEAIARKSQPQVASTTVIFGNGVVQHIETIDISDDDQCNNTTALIASLASNNVQITQVTKTKSIKKKRYPIRNNGKNKNFELSKRNASAMVCQAKGTVVIDDDESDSESNGMHQSIKRSKALETPRATARMIATTRIQQVVETDDNNNWVDFVNRNTTPVECIPMDVDRGEPIVDIDRRTILNELNTQFQAFDQEITNRDKLIRSKDLEIAALKRKTNMVEANLKSVLECFKKVKNIHKTLVESCECLDKEKNLRNQDYAASIQMHEQAVETAKTQHQAVLDQLYKTLRK